MSAKRKSYSVEYKKGIVEDSQNKNLTTFCKENLDRRLVRKWRAEYDNLSKQVEEGNAKKRKLGSGRQPLFPELEDITYDWIANRRSRASVVRRANIQAFAIAIARVTCVLEIRLDGTKVPPLIIAKGKRNNIQKVSGIYVLETEKAWCTQAVLRQWIDLILPTILRGSQRGLLV